MTQEERDLLITDLCSRLKYGVIGRVYAECSAGEYDMISGDMIFVDKPFDVILDGINVSTGEIHVTAIGNEDTVEFIEEQQVDGSPYYIEDFTPYLRPMSDMREDEVDFDLEDRTTLKGLDAEVEYDPDFERIRTAMYVICNDIRYEDTDKFPPIDQLDMYKTVDWLNKHGFDYRGLLPKKLALKAKEGMYKTE